MPARWSSRRAIASSAPPCSDSSTSFPACRSLDDVARHLRDFVDEVPDVPPSLSAAMRIADVRAAPPGARRGGRGRRQAHGPPVHRRRDARATRSRCCGRLWERGVASTVDLLGEATVTPAEADVYAGRCLEALEQLAGEAPPLARAPRAGARLERAASPRERVGEDLRADAAAPGRTRPRSASATPPSGCGRCSAVRASLAPTSTSTWSRSTRARRCSSWCWSCWPTRNSRSGPSAGVVLQAYLRDSPEQLATVLDWARAGSREPPLQVRLVKGAYWDHELVEARQQGWPTPVFEVKADCDRNFEALTRTLLDARPLVRVAIASHNLRSVSHAIAYNRLSGGEDSEPRAPGAARARRRAPGRARGERVPGPHVLPRRGPGRGDGVPGPQAAREHQQRVVPPRAGQRPRPGGAAGRRHDRADAARRRSTTSRCSSCAAPRSAPGSARRSRGVDALLPLNVPVMIGDSTRPGDELRLDRSGGARAARRAGGGRARRTRCSRRWPRRGRGSAAGAGPPPGSARRRSSAPRHGCASGGSSWRRSRSASAPSRGRRPTPTCARRSTSSSTTRAAAIELDAGAPLLQVPGERNELRYLPRGVAAVISPWNFPIAIPCGMTAAALATGNAVVLKPAEQAPACGLRIVEALRAGGVPPAAISLLPGEGEVGAALVRHPGRRDDRVHRIAGGRARDQPRRRRAAARAARDQAGDRRARRQELRDRRRRRRPRRGRAGDRRIRVRVRRAEVLGGVPGARPRGDRRPPDRARRRRGRGARRRAGRPARNRGPAGDRARGPRADRPLRGARRVGGADRRASGARAGAGLVLRPDRRRRPAAGLGGAGRGGVRTAADDRARARRGARDGRRRAAFPTR